MDGLVENSIIYHNAADVKPGDEDEQFEGDQIEIRYSTVQDLSTPHPDHPGTIAADPQFIQAPVLSNPQFNIPPYTPGDLHLQSASPCIDAGDNGAVPQNVTTDLDGLPRFVDVPGAPNVGVGKPPHVDFGAYEVQPAGEPPGDIDHDGDVDPADLAQLLATWGPCAVPSSCPADLNGDGSVGPFDLAQLLANWS
jgi:hypothetical protein